MRLLSLPGLAVAALLAAPVAATAATLTVSIDGIALYGVGSCVYAPSGCTDPNLPPGYDADGNAFDQVMLVPTAIPVSSNASSVGLGQTYVFVPGDTGAGSTGFNPSFSLDRVITVSYGTASLTQTLIQSGDILVGVYEDTLTIHASDALVFNLAPLGFSHLLTLRLGLATVTAGIDPVGVVPGEIVLNAIPAPPTLLLLAIGLACGVATKKRLRALPPIG